MAHEESSEFINRTYMENLLYIPLQDVEPVNLDNTNKAFKALLDESGLTTNDVKNRVTALLNGTAVDNSSNPIPKPKSWEEFILGFRNAAPSLGNANPLDGDIYEGFIEQYRELLHIGGSFGQPLIGDWSILDGVAGAPNINDQFVSAFDHFIESNSFTNAQNFFEKLHKYYTVTAVLQNATIPSTGVTDISSYEKIFNAIFPGASTLDFENRLKDFYLDKLKHTGNNVVSLGFFIPSQHFDEWVQELTEEVNFVATLLSDSNFDPERKLLGIDRVLKLLILMVEVIYDVAAVQSDRLFVLADWQKKYTEKLEQLPIIGGSSASSSVPNPNAIFDGTSDAIKQLRTDLNQTVIQTLVTRIRGQRDLVKDDTKAFQASVSQSQDAANQQAQIGTAFLQQLSGILAAIYR